MIKDLTLIRQRFDIAAAGSPPNPFLSAARTYQEVFKGDFYRIGLPHHAGSVPTAISIRDERLPWLLAVDAAKWEIHHALQMRHVDWRDGANSVVMLYRSFGVKPGEVNHLVKGAMAALLADDFAAIGGWQPVKATPRIIDLAVYKLLQQKEKFIPRPAELVQACREARSRLLSARDRCQGWLDDLLAADAVLLQFSHDEWARPYRLPEYRQALEWVLNKHEAENLGAEFEKMVEQEQIKAFVPGEI